jgi:hypothetical protein
VFPRARSGSRGFDNRRDDTTRTHRIPGANGTCAALDQTFPHTGLFGLPIATAPSLLPAGDLYLRVY